MEETDKESRNLLAMCLGEVGAIGAHQLEERKSSSPWHEKLGSGPWHSRADRYVLTLVTRQSVAALKAAPTSNDQHKIAFMIQQLLALLDRAASAGHSSKRSAPTTTDGKQEMSSWLSSRLSSAGVLEVVEPFWWTEFCEVSVLLRRVLFLTFRQILNFCNAGCKGRGGGIKAPSFFSELIDILFLDVRLVPVHGDEVPRGSEKQVE